MTRNDATQRQIDSADPRQSTWLTANAGSGKTRVLTDRVARLLLDGVSPQNILCLTYTKAAASEMQNRLFKRLGQWSMKDDSALAKELLELGIDGLGETEGLARARTLFAGALETPGGLKIQTIHSFCASLLRRFPLEAGISPFFKEIEDRAAKLLREDVVDDMSGGADAALVHRLAAHYTGEDLAGLTAEIVRNREALEQPRARKSIWQQFGLDAGFDEARLHAKIFRGGEESLMLRLISCLRSSSKITDQEKADKLEQMNFQSPSDQDLEKIFSVFLFGEKANTPFGAKTGRFATKAIQSANVELMAELDEFMLRVETARSFKVKLRSAEKTFALHEFAAVFLANYSAKKQVRGWLDFDDLIHRAKSLLTDPAVAQWVLFRLDGGIDHILVDEAQDTSPVQWKVIELLAQEFTAGQGSRENVNRTIFVVGDQKQSIYSFQGADPKAFGAMREHFATQISALGNQLKERSLDYSFRSSSAILNLVDSTFSAVRGLGLGGDSFHLAFKNKMPGRVDLWPLVPVSDEPKEREWYDPTDKIASNDHRVVLAKNVATEISNLMKTGSIPAENGGFRKIRAGDFLILVQRRSGLFHEIIRACKNLQLPIAGADRLRIGAELAVKDITALISFLAIQDDDLSLAACLRSPLFGWTENQLFDLAHNRHEPRLWPALLRRSAEFPETLAILSDLRNQADFLSPYELIERILTRHDGRDRLLGRLGLEAEDGIDALISQALAYERSETPSLTGFITWLEIDSVEIKRHTDSSGDRIRVMTTHGAKGLEAPIVILPDTSKRVLRMTNQIVPLDGGDLVWKSSAGQQTEDERSALERMRDAQKEEGMRLLYVALTRAENWLIICGSGEEATDGQSWHDLVKTGMNAAGAKSVQHPVGQILRLQNEPWKPADSAQVSEHSEMNSAVPDWTHEHALPPVKSPTTVSPTGLGGAKVLFEGSSGDIDAEETAMQKGSLLHVLLEILPLYEPSKWADAISFYVERAKGSLSDQDCKDIEAQVVHLLENPNLSHIFASDSLAEVDISASLPELDGTRLHGTIDRLIISESKVLCVDFKSNQNVPTTPKAVPEGLLRQMAAYLSALEQIYPNKAVEVAILWTQTANLMVLPHDIVRSAISNATTS